MMEPAASSSTVMPTDQQPQNRSVSDFHKGEEIGRGAYGVVYDVTEKQTGHLYVMKVITFPSNSDGVPQSVIREISALMSIKKLKHPNIVQLYDAFVSQDDGNTVLSILYEKCNWDLHFFLKKIPRKMEEPQIKWYVYQLFGALEFLHSHNIVHRDVKPENILLNVNQQLKLADFGLARNFSMHATYTTTVVTLWYRAPEILLQSDYNSSVDIWSGGCVIYELFQREALFPGNNEGETLFLIIDKLGTPDISDWPHDAVVEHSSFKKIPKKSIVTHLPEIADNYRLIHLLDTILSFNPHNRPTAKDIVANMWFDEYRKVPPRH